MENTDTSSAKTLSIVSLVTSLLGISLVGIITGHISISQYNKAGVKEGKGLAIAGLIIGYIGMAIVILATIAALATPAILKAQERAMEIEGSPSQELFVDPTE